MITTRFANRFLPALVLSLVAFFAGAPAFAQVPGLIHLGAGIGKSLPSGDTKDALENGIHGEVLLSVDVPRIPIGLRGIAMYERFDLKSETESDGRATILSVAVNGVYFLPTGPIRPYVTAGLGTYRLKSDVEGADTETAFGINGGVGLELGLVLVRGFAEARIENISTEDGPGGGATRVIPITIGVLF
jgi:hypothetical protein